jgi:hypothetical protein
VILWGVLWREPPIPTIARRGMCGGMCGDDPSRHSESQRRTAQNPTQNYGVLFSFARIGCSGGSHNRNNQGFINLFKAANAWDCSGWSLGLA